MKLTICIVTFNDRDELIYSLDALRIHQNALQELALKGEVEIIVSDNASNDDTQGVLANYKKELVIPIRLYLQKQNLGFRGNMEFCASVATGQWVLYLGAGSLLHIPGVEKFVSEVWPEECNLVYFNSQTLDVRTGLLQLSTYSKEDKPAYAQAPFPIYRRLLLLETILRKGNVSGDDWPQVEWAIEMSGSGPEAISILEELLISGNRPDFGWWSKPSAFLVPLSMNFVLGHYLKVSRWNESKLREGISSSYLVPAKWIYQSRVAHMSRRPLFRHVMTVAKYYFGFWKGAAATAVAIATWVLPRRTLRVIGRIVRLLRPGPD